eukprot:CAMPEP_0201282078 /NCGR_PEP_ID=MMETSP1317-20130820/4772_1 /ASSEMBLY_ACC=CAM_ASM_000770 /TAXON_ID=187299 /ORGANISM="Undescribed Undescribed, Strain Undescribed" /LENGTH=62 /DNA_ID=CAMNT_0047593781 /DNA_START=531 /DNA_END=719 /DNA_ORIENTATION=-
MPLDTWQNKGKWQQPSTLLPSDSCHRQESKLIKDGEFEEATKVNKETEERQRYDQILRTTTS